MDNGIIEVSSGRLIELGDRSDLLRDDVQELLNRCHRKPGSLICGCGLYSDRSLRLIVARNGSRFNVLRECARDHPDWCFSVRWCDDSPVRASSILEAPTARCDPLGKGEGHADTSLRYDTFSEYARKIFSRALCHAFIRENEHPIEIRNPAATAVLDCIPTAITELPFTSGRDGFVEAAAIGAQLRFGLCFGQPAESVSAAGGFAVFWWNYEGACFDLSLATCNADALRLALANLKVFENYLSPPYFVFGVANSDGVLQRCYFHQVAVAEDYLVPTESGFERNFATDLAQRKIPMVKPVRIDDATCALAHLGITLDGDWPFRPDFLVPCQSRGGLQLQIKEIRGFKERSLPRYDQWMNAKAQVGPSLRGSVPILYEPIAGKEIPEKCSSSNGPSEWGHTVVRII